MGKKSQPKAPEAIDPLEIIRTQAAYNRTNQVNPFGSTTWSGDENSGFTQTQALNPQMQAGLDRVMGRMTNDSPGYQRPEQMGQMLQSLMNKRQGIQGPVTPQLGPSPTGPQGNMAGQQFEGPSVSSMPEIPSSDQQSPGQDNLRDALMGISNVSRGFGGVRPQGPNRIKLPDLSGNDRMTHSYNPFMGAFK